MYAPSPWLVSIALCLLSLAVVQDLRSRQISDWISLALLACAVLTGIVGWDQVGWLQRGIGLATGFGLGACLFYLGGLGGGDAKVLGGLGACLGVWPLLSILFYMALAGGVISAVAGARGAREVPYGPAIWVGTVVWVVLFHWFPGAWMVFP